MCFTIEDGQNDDLRANGYWRLARETTGTYSGCHMLRFTNSLNNMPRGGSAVANRSLYATSATVTATSRETSRNWPNRGKSMP